MDGLREYIERVWQQQYDVAWRSFVHERFRDHPRAVGERRRRLVLDLSLSDTAVPALQIAVLTPRLARAYARKTDKTLTRDLKAVLDMGLVVKEPGGYRARKEVILGFLPVRAPGS